MSSDLIVLGVISFLAGFVRAYRRRRMYRDLDRKPHEHLWPAATKEDDDG